MKAPTQKQVDAEVKRLQDLKYKIPSQTIFGDDNIARVEAQIEVLEKEMSEDDIYDRCDENKTAEEDLWSQDLESIARDALLWRDGEQKEKPSDGWKPLIRK